MRNQKERILGELYDLTPQILKPEITPVLEGAFRIQGPMDETVNDISANLVEPKKKSMKHLVDANFHARALSGTCNVCSAPCSSCAHHSKAESIMESKVEDVFQGSNLSRREADNFSSMNSGLTASRKNRTCEDADQVASEGSNFLSESSSHDSFSENADSRTAVRIPNTCDVSKDGSMPNKVFPDKSIFGDGLQPKASTTEDINTQSVLLSTTISDSLPQKTSSQDENKCALGTHGDNASCISRSSDVNKDGHPNNDTGRQNLLYSSTLTSDLPSKDHKNLRIQDAYGANAETETNPRSSGEYINEFPKKYVCSGPENGVFHGKPEPSEYSSQTKECFLGDPDSRESEERPCIQSPQVSSENSLKQESSRLAGTSIAKTDDDKSPISASVNESLEIGERKCSLSISEISPDAAKDSHKNTKGVVADGTNSSNELTKSDIMKLEKQNTVTDSKLCASVMEKSESSSVDIKCIQKSVKCGSDVGCENSSVPIGNSDIRREEHGNSSIEPDLLEDDVKVCDICGDAGREDLLAICSKCSDGAEHTYCMRIMLDKVPEADWLCEECKFKEDAASKQVIKPEPLSRMSKEPSFNRSRQDFGSIKNNNDQPKLDKKTPTASGTQPVKGFQSSRVPIKKNVDDINSATPSNRKAQEIKSPNAILSGIGSPTSKKFLSRESSSKGLDAVKVRSGEISLIPANSSPAQVHSLTSSEHNLSNIQARYNSAKGSLSKSSFDKAKVKLVTDHIPLKSKSFNEPTRIDTKREVSRIIGKSASFKGMGRSNSGIDSNCRPQHVSRTEDTRSLLQGKEKGITEKRNPSMADRPHLSSSMPSASSISTKKDTRTASHDVKLSFQSEADIPVANIGPETAHGSVMLDDRQQQSSNTEKNCPPNGEFTYEDQKQIRGPTADANMNKSCDPVVQMGSLQSAQSAGFDVKNKPVSLSNSRQAVPSSGKVLKRRICNETGHATQFCSINKTHLTALKPSGERNQVGKTNKWKDAAEASVLKARFHTNNRLSDQPSRLSLPSSSLSKKISAKNQLDLSGHFKNSTPSGETIDVEESPRSVANNSKKTTVQNDSKQIAPLPIETTHASEIVDPVNQSDALKSAKLSEVVPDKASMCSSLLRASAFPETCHIWQGSFEVHRSASLCNLHDGIQAHLSNCASPKVLEVATSFPCKVQLEEASCVDSWPLQFRHRSPTEENIALFFFATDFDSYEKSYKRLVDDMIKNDLVLKGSVVGGELLIFPSNKLPQKAQCWNGFQYLWGVLRAKKSDFSDRDPYYEKKSHQSSSDAERTGEDFPPHSASNSASVRENSCWPVLEESPTCHMQVKIDEGGRPCTTANAEIASCGSKGWSFDLNENSHDDKPLEEVVIDNSIPSKKKRSCSSLESSSVSVIKETRVLGNCGKLYEVGAIHCPQEGNNELANVEMDAGFSGKDILPQLLTCKGKSIDTLTVCTAVPQPTFSVNGNAVEKEKTKANEILIDLEAIPESIMHEEHFESDPANLVKRIGSCSHEPVSGTCGEVLAGKPMLWKEEPLLSATQEPKKMKLHHGKHASDNEFTEHQGSERDFFSVGSSPLAEPKAADIVRGNEGASRMDVPNLELALGGERERRKQKVLPLFFSSDHAKPSNSVLHRGDDDPASLSLSLAVCSPERVPLTRRPEQVENANSSRRMGQHLPERANLKSSLLLFGGVIDSGKR